MKALLVIILFLYFSCLEAQVSSTRNVQLLPVVVDAIDAYMLENPYPEDSSCVIDIYLISDTLYVFYNGVISSYQFNRPPQMYSFHKSIPVAIFANIPIKSIPKSQTINMFYDWYFTTKNQIFLLQAKGQRQIVFNDDLVYSYKFELDKYKIIDKSIRPRSILLNQFRANYKRVYVSD